MGMDEEWWAEVGAPVTKLLSDQRFGLLSRLIESGGHCRGEDLTMAARRLGSMMQMDRLTDWQRPDRRSENLNDWLLHITLTGRATVEVELQRRERVGKRKEPRGLTDDRHLVAEQLAISLRLYSKREHRVGMRSGTLDAAAVCDAISTQILSGGRRSRDRTALAAVAKRCADAIEAMRDGIDVPDA